MSKDFVKLSILYDFYENLLTQKQRDVFSLYYSENMSLSEIAEEFHISRQAVHDTLKNAESVLGEYEKALGLIAKAQKRELLSKKAVNLVDECLQNARGSEDEKSLIELKATIEAMES